MISSERLEEKMYFHSEEKSSHNLKHQSNDNENDKVERFLKNSRLFYGIGVPLIILSYFLVIFTNIKSK